MSDMWDRFPPRMRKSITTALELAGQRGADQASAEHLLLAIARDPASAASCMFHDLGIDPDALIAKLQPPEATGHSHPQPWSERAGRLSASALHVLDVAQAQADRLGDRHVGTEHVALALALTNNTESAALLKALGLTHDNALAALKRWRRRGMPRTQNAAHHERISSPLARAIFSPLHRLMRIPRLAWHIYIGKSLGHPEFVTDPYPLYARLRERSPVRQDPLAPVWVITRYAETMQMLRDPRFRKDPFAGERLPPAAREQLKVSDAAAGRASAEMVSMLFLDPPEHTRVRSIFTRAFTPRRLENLRPRIERITATLLERADSNARSGDGTFDLVRDLAYPLPVTVIAELLGFPPEDYEKIKKWSDEMADALALNPTPQAQARAYRAREEIRAYFNTVVASLREKPGENLISALLSGEAYGERGERLNPDELFSNSILLLAAGHETTTGLIANGVLALLRHPEQLRALRKHPHDLIESAVEEILRFDPPVQWTSRVAGEDLIMAGQAISRGQIVLASVGAANRDPAVFPDPDRFDIRRADNKHLSFGAGIHFCLGAALARMEAQIAIGTLLRQFPNLELAQKKVKWRKGLTFRGVQALRLKRS
jgi:cytochrome P450